MGNKITNYTLPSLWELKGVSMRLNCFLKIASLIQANYIMNKQFHASSLKKVIIVLLTCMTLALEEKFLGIVAGCDMKGRNSPSFNRFTD